jgi:hypothetical protein
MLVLRPATGELRALALTDLLFTQALPAIDSANPDSAARQLIAWLAAFAPPASAGEKPVWESLRRITAAKKLPVAVQAALEKLGSERLLARLVDLSDELPFLFQEDNGAVRLVKLAELVDGKAVELGLEAKGSKKLSGSDGPAFVVSGHAALGLELRVRSPAEVEKDFGLALRPAHAALVLKAAGELGGGAEWTAGPIAFGLSAQASRGLAAVADFPADKSSVSALHALASRLPTDLSPAALHGALAAPGHDGPALIQIDRARGMTMTLGGEASAGFVDLRIAHAGRKPFPIEDTVAASLSLTVRHQDSAQRRLRIRRDASGGLRLESHTVSSTERDVDLSLGAGVSIEGWDKVAAALVEANLPDAQALIDELRTKGLLTPGTLLQAELGKALSKHVPKPMAALLTGESDAKAASKALLAQVVARLDARLAPWQAVSQQRLDALVIALADSLLPKHYDSERQALVDRLHKVLSEFDLIATARQHLTDAATEWAGQLSKEVLEAFAAVGTAVKNVATKANALAEHILTVLTRYEAFRGKLLGAAEQAAKLKFGIAIEQARRVRASDALDYALVIPATALTSDEARADFAAWLNGRPFRDQERPFGVAQDQDWRATSERSGSVSTAIRFDLVLGNASTRELLETSTRIEVGPGGVLCARTRASASKEYALSWTKEKVSASAQALFDALAAAEPMTAFSLDLAFEDGRFEKRELVSILASIDRAGEGLLEEAVKERLQSQWEALFAADGRKAPKAALRLAMALGSDGRRRLRKLTEDPDELKRALVRAMVAATYGRPGFDLVVACKTLGRGADPVAAFLQEWDLFSRNRKEKDIDYITGVKSGRGGDAYHAGRAVQRAIRPLNGLFGALSLANNWPDAKARHQKIGTQVASQHKDKAPPYQALLASRQLADELDRAGAAFAEALGDSLTAADTLIDVNANAPIASLFVMVFLARECGAELTGELVALP